jgi:prepilin-type N-terminal cleavage/methylation domain-containing protein
MKTNKKINKGFTLIELLVVIAIIAILMVTVVITLNPGQLMAQARDSNRLSDLSTLKTAINLYLADVSTTTPIGNPGTCYMATSSNGGTAPTGNWCVAWFGSSATTSVIGSRAISNNGWLPINFSLISSGAPFSQLPIDPVDSYGVGTSTSTSLMYTYAVSSTSIFKLDAHMESTKFKQGGSNDVCSNDGGIDPYSYETGPGVGLF